MSPRLPPASTPQVSVPEAPAGDPPPSLTTETKIPVEIGPAPGIDIVVAGMVRDAHAKSAPLDDRPPPPLPGRGPYKVIDVPGTWTRAISSTWHFEETLNRLPLGPVLVTARFEPNEANKYGISLYVDGQQLGWLGTDWTARDPYVKFIRRLDAAGILPRFQGLHRLIGNTHDHIINFDVPGQGDGRLGDIARPDYQQASQSERQVTLSLVG